MDKLKGPISRIKDLLLRGIEMFGEARVSVYAGVRRLCDTIHRDGHIPLPYADHIHRKPAPGIFGI